MRVSVVIPAHNEEGYIEKCLVSLGNQKEKPDEIIVVDNNCIDKTISIAKKFAVKIVREKKQGIIFARNTGFNSAQHDIIARCDADSILPINWIKKIKRDFERRKIDALTGPMSFYDAPLENTAAVKAYMTIVHRILRHYPLNGPNCAVTKKIWNKVRGSVCHDDILVHEDIDLSIHITEAGGKIHYDQLLVVGVSARRMKNNPVSFFVEYPSRLIKMVQDHKKLEKSNR